MDKKIGHYSFIGAIVLAIAVGIMNPFIADGTLAPAEKYGEIVQWLISVMVVLGLIVGAMNINAKQRRDYLMIATMLIIAAGIGGAASIFGGVIHLGVFIQGIFQGILAVIIPATVVVLLKEIWGMCQSKK